MSEACLHPCSTSALFSPHRRAYTMAQKPHDKDGKENRHKKDFKPPGRNSAHMTSTTQTTAATVK